MVFVAVARSVLAALDDLHQRGVVHLNPDVSVPTRLACNL
jgi:hypothetical protein